MREDLPRQTEAKVITMPKKKQTDDNRKPFQINLSDDEKKRLTEAADVAGLPLATFIRSKALEALNGEATHG